MNIYSKNIIQIITSYQTIKSSYTIYIKMSDILSLKNEITKLEIDIDNEYLQGTSFLRSAPILEELQEKLKSKIKDLKRLELLESQQQLQ